jgi:ubiquinone/menaquinone biosynthesis C-methylase UbiE
VNLRKIALSPARYMSRPDEVSYEERRIRAVFAQRQNDARYAWTTPAHVFMMQTVERRLLATLSHEGITSLAGKRILEIGCGTGNWLREFVKWGAEPQNVMGIDLLAEAVGQARGRCAQGVRLFCGSAVAVPLRGASCDLVAQFTVFTSILEPDFKRQVASEMLRVIKPNGLILWYDFSFNNPKNSDVRGVGKKEIQWLFPGCSVKLRRVTLAPPITRRLAFRSWLACSLLEAMPLLRTHFLGVIRKN